MSFFNWLEKNPFEALLAGGAIAATGGAAAPVLGAEAATPIVGGYFAGATPAELLAANGGASSGLLGSLPSMKEAAGYIKPIGDAAGAANAVGGLLGGQQQPVQSHAPQGANPAGSQTLASLYQSGMQMSPEDQARMQRKTQWG
jgi:hypothetical protein